MLNPSPRMHTRPVSVLLALILCMGMTTLFSGCDASVLRIVELKQPPHTVEYPLAYEADEGLALSVALNLINGEDCPITVLPPEAGASPRAVISYPADFTEHGFSVKAEEGTLTVVTPGATQFKTKDFAMTVYADVSRYDLSGALVLNATASDRALTQVSVAIRGSAECTLSSLSAQAVTLTADGAADVILAGNAETLTATVNGAGAVEADALLAKNGVVTVNGAGAAWVNVSDTLSVTIRGAGTVTYHGDPVITRDIAGAGAITPAKD